MDETRSLNQDFGAGAVPFAAMVIALSQKRPDFALLDRVIEASLLALMCNQSLEEVHQWLDQGVIPEFPHPRGRGCRMREVVLSTIPVIEELRLTHALLDPSGRAVEWIRALPATPWIEGDRGRIHGISSADPRKQKATHALENQLIRLVAAPRADLNPEEMHRACSIVERAGRTLVSPQERGWYVETWPEPSLPCAPPSYLGYLQSLRSLEKIYPDCVERWRSEIHTGDIEKDPRVQAWCKGRNDHVHEVKALLQEAAQAIAQTQQSWHGDLFPIGGSDLFNYGLWSDTQERRFAYFSFREVEFHVTQTLADQADLALRLGATYLESILGSEEFHRLKRVSEQDADATAIQIQGHLEAQHKGWHHLGKQVLQSPGAWQQVLLTPLFDRYQVEAANTGWVVEIEEFSPRLIAELVTDRLSEP